MPNIKSSMKRVKIIRERTLRNASARSALRTAVKCFETALAAADVEKMKTALVNAIQALDKAAGKGLIHKNMAARKKSRLTKKFNNFSA
ncbi:MAG: 30S ribosomal protein S20 [Heliobacteriaceae bacterium]|nr:30S ribosomal protein S20 [Heliobacteriaceae bacterium]MDD4586876.1 30S ribosomal protein S20 [Heliobacteriaceae bacterium]